MRSLVLGLALVPIQAAPSQPKAGLEPSPLERRMVELVNIERAARGLPQLTVSPELTRVARAYSGLMAAQRRVDHGFDGSLTDRIRGAEPDACTFGENVSKHTSIDYSVGDLMLSPGHRKNILHEEYTLIGIGIVPGDDGFLYITQDFAKTCQRGARHAPENLSAPGPARPSRHRAER